MANRVRAPVNWTDQITNNKSWHEDKYMKMYFNRKLQHELRCRYCHKYLCVGPFFYRNEDMNRSCGRCYDQTGLDVSTYSEGVLQDHLYEKLLPHLFFECCNPRCPERLFPHQAKEHDKYCGLISPSQFDARKLVNTDGRLSGLYVTVPNVRELREKLSCDTCAKPLSVLPVVSNGYRFVCGRCTSPNFGSNWVEQKIYAIMAEYMQFPCANRGCTELLLTTQVETHEKTCRWTETQCPLLCGKVLRVFELSFHMRSDHLDDATDQLQLKPQTVLCQIDSEPYVVSIEAVDKELFTCAVYGLDEKDYDYLGVEIVNDKVVWIRVAQFKLKLDVSKNGVRIRSRRKNAFLRLTKAKYSQGQDILVLVCLNGCPSTEDMTERLECDVCLYYMSGEIYKCENRHPICGNCKRRVTLCPMCRGVLQYDRHFELEVEANVTRFPCEFQESNNCQVALPPKFLRPHHFRCRLQGAVRSEKCSFARCNVQVHSLEYDYFYNHCVQHHRRLVMHQGNAETVTWSAEDFTKASRHCRVLFFDGEVFFVLCKVGGGAPGAPQGVTFCVMQRTANGKKYNYKLELDRNGLVVERRGTCNVHRPSKLGVDVKVEFEVVQGMLVKTTEPEYNYCYHVNRELVLTYRVNLEVVVEKEYEYVDNYLEPADVFNNENYTIDDFSN